MTGDSDDKTRRAQERLAEGASADDVSDALAEGWGDDDASSAASPRASDYDQAAAEIDAWESGAHAPVGARGAVDAHADHESDAAAAADEDEQAEEDEDDLEARRAQAFAQLRVTRECGRGNGGG